MFWEKPVLLVEVLSLSIEAYDRGDKFTSYKSIPIFREYLLVAQHRPHVTHYVTQDEGKWSYEEFNEIKDSVHPETVDCTLSLGDVYRDSRVSG